MTNAHSFKIYWPPLEREIDIRVEYEYYDFLKIHWPHDFANLITAYKVLEKPNRIFFGLNRSHSDSTKKYCVIGKPDHWYVGESNSEVPFPPKCVFEVFLDERHSIFEFGVEEADTEDQLCSVGWRERFGELIWKIS